MAWGRKAREQEARMNAQEERMNALMEENAELRAAQAETRRGQREEQTRFDAMSAHEKVEVFFNQLRAGIIDEFQLENQLLELADQMATDPRTTDRDAKAFNSAVERQAKRVEREVTREQRAADREDSRVTNRNKILGDFEGKLTTQLGSITGKKDKLADTRDDIEDKKLGL